MILKLMTYNIRGACWAAQDGVNAWENRSSINVELLKKYSPDIIAFQELQQPNLDLYKKEIGEYKYLLGPKYDNNEPHNYNAILWKKEKVRLVASGGFWLSKTPEEFSGDWGTLCIRSASWARFNCGRTEFVLVNTHIDHGSELARQEGIKLILRQMENLQLDAMPMLLTMDSNQNPGSTVYTLLTGAGFRDVFLEAGNKDENGVYTFNNYKDTQDPIDTRIDWIMLKDTKAILKTKSSSIITDNKHPLYPSDHFPVAAELEISIGKDNT